MESSTHSISIAVNSIRAAAVKQFAGIKANETIKIKELNQTIQSLVQCNFELMSHDQLLIIKQNFDGVTNKIKESQIDKKDKQVFEELARNLLLKLDNPVETLIHPAYHENAITKALYFENAVAKAFDFKIDPDVVRNVTEGILNEGLKHLAPGMDGVFILRKGTAYTAENKIFVLSSKRPNERVKHCPIKLINNEWTAPYTSHDGEAKIFRDRNLNSFLNSFIELCYKHYQPLFAPSTVSEEDIFKRLVIGYALND